MEMSSLFVFIGEYAIKVPQKVDKTEKSEESNHPARKSSISGDEAISFIEVASNGPGSSFGELALLYRKPRAATITTKTKSIFAVLDKNLYQKILGK